MIYPLAHFLYTHPLQLYIKEWPFYTTEVFTSYTFGDGDCMVTFSMIIIVKKG